MTLTHYSGSTSSPEHSASSGGPCHGYANGCVCLVCQRRANDYRYLTTQQESYLTNTEAADLAVDPEAVNWFRRIVGHEEIPVGGPSTLSSLP